MSRKSHCVTSSVPSAFSVAEYYAGRVLSANSECDCHLSHPPAWHLNLTPTAMLLNYWCIGKQPTAISSIVVEQGDTFGRLKALLRRELEWGANFVDAGIWIVNISLEEQPEYLSRGSWGTAHHPLCDKDQVWPSCLVEIALEKGGQKLAQPNTNLHIIIQPPLPILLSEFITLGYSPSF